MATIAIAAVFKSLAATAATTSAGIAAAGSAMAATGGIVGAAGVGLGAAGAAAGAASAGSFAAMAAVGSIAGMYIDSAFIMPRLFKQNSDSEAKGIGITGLDEGDPHLHAMGPYNRVPGFLYWQPKKPRFVKGESGGKGGGSSKSGSADRYYSDGVYALTRTHYDENVQPAVPYPARTEVTQVWLDGKLRFIGNSALKSESQGYEIYENIENQNGKVSIIYTIQTIDAEPPGGEAYADWTLIDKFRQGLETVIDNSAQSPILQAPLFARRTTLGIEGGTAEKPLALVGVGTLGEGPNGEPAGRQYVQFEWQYWRDRSVYVSYTQLSNGETVYDWDETFYQMTTFTNETYIDPWGNIRTRQVSRFPSGHVPYDLFLSGEWVGMLGTTPVANTGGAVQQRGNLNPANTGPGLKVRQISRSYARNLLRDISMRDGQTSSPIGVLEAEEGPGQPTLRGHSALVIEGLDLMDFGQRMPNVEALVQQDRLPLTLGEAIYRVCCVMHDLDPEMLDVSLLEGTPERVYGYWFASPYGLDALQPLIIAYDLSVLEDSGKLVFRRRVDAPEYTIPEGDLTAQSGGRIGPVMAVREDSASTATLSTVVQYTDREGGLGEAEQIFTRPDLETGRLEQLDLTRLALTAREARAIAQRATWQSQMFEQTVEFVVGPKWGHLRSGDVVNLYDVLDQDWRVVLTAIDRGADGRLSCVGYRDYGLADEMPVLDVDVGGAPSGQNSFYAPPFMQMADLDIGPLSLSDANTPGVYLASCAKFYDSDFRGSRWYYANNSSEVQREYVPVADDSATECVMGVLIDPLPEAPPDTVQQLAPVRVRLYEGELESVPEESVFRRDQLLWVGGEVIAFQDAEVIDDNEFGLDHIYQISGSTLRGLYNTEHRITSHPEGTSFALIEPSKLRRAEIDANQVDGVEHRFQAVAASGDTPYWDNEDGGTTAVGNPEGEESNYGSNGRPFPPGSVGAFWRPTSLGQLPWQSFAFYSVGDERFVFDAEGYRTSYRCILEHNPATVAAGTPVYPPDDVAAGSNGEGTYWRELAPTRDYVITWTFRARVPIPALPLSTEEVRRQGTTYTLKIYRLDNSNLILEREILDIEDTRYEYTHDQMVEDGIDPGDDFVIKLRADTSVMSSEEITVQLPRYD